MVNALMTDIPANQIIPQCKDHIANLYKDRTSVRTLSVWSNQPLL